MELRKVLAVGAHPDDIEILCAGTMARYVGLGVEVVLCNATTGNRGGYHSSMQELGDTRDAEAREAAAVIGAAYTCLGFDDCSLVHDASTRERFTDLIRQVGPDVVFTHDPQDYHADHVATSKLVFEASFLASVPLLATTRPASERILPVFYMDTLAGLGFSPEQYVDIGGAMDTKRDMLGRHHSQVGWLRQHDGLDLLDFMETMARFRGYQAGVRYAEAFRPAHNWLRNSTERILP